MIKFINDKRKIILTILIFLFAVSLIYRITHPYKQPKVDTLTYSSSKSERADKKIDPKDTGNSAGKESLIKLDMFFNPPVHSGGLRRNIFSKEEEMEEMAVFPEKYEIDQTHKNEPSANTENNVEDDLRSFESFGYMERDGERILFLEKGKQIMLVRKGDRIEGKYLVKDITKNELILTVISNNETIYIDLSDL